MDPFTLRASPSPGRCLVAGCRSRVVDPRSNGRFCRRCRERRYKALHPYTYSLNKLRNNARRRGVAFDLTLEEWIMFCDLTGYVFAHGRGADDLSIDRIDPSIGYTISNIRAITVSQNARKSAVERKLDRLARIRAAVARTFAKAA